MKRALLFLAACHGGGDKPQPSRGSGRVSPVEIVNQPQFPDAGGRANGASGDEIEPNDSDEVATPFPLDSTMRGKIDETDNDHFRIDVDKPGALSLMVNAVDADLVVELEDGNGALVARSDRGGARVKEGLPNFGVVPGRYTAIVKQAVKRKAKPAKGKAAAPMLAVAYELTSALVAIPPNTEHEPDEDRGTADDLIVGDTGTGYVGWNNDVDVWKLSVETLSAKNTIDIEVSAVEGVALELDVDDGIGNNVLDRKAPRGAPLVVRGLVPNVPASSPPFHYLTVKGQGSNPETPYTIKVTQQVPQVDAEIEPNDTWDKPFSIPADRTVVHARWSPGDVDCFALGNGAVVVDVNPPTDFDPSLELFVDGKSSQLVNRAKTGGEEKLTAAAALPGQQRRVVCVKNADASAVAETAYDVTVQDDAP